MKARLLKKLRKKCAKKYTIFKGPGYWTVHYNTFSLSRKDNFSSIDAAKKFCIEKIQEDIRREVCSLREKYPYSRSINFYPW